jgi:Flp pilus assembly protein TadB
MVTDSIGKNAADAALKNEQLGVVLAECGGLKRPTVAQWLQNKLQQQRSSMQEELMYLDRTKSQRRGVVTAQKQLTKFRADRHQGWEKQKQLQDKLKNIKQKNEELISTAFAFPGNCSAYSIRFYFLGLSCYFFVKLIDWLFLCMICLYITWFLLCLI